MSGKTDPLLVERLARFRAMAVEAREAALKAETPELKQAYENLVHSWEELIGEIEAANKR